MHPAYHLKNIRALSSTLEIADFKVERSNRGIFGKVRTLEREAARSRHLELLTVMLMLRIGHRLNAPRLNIRDFSAAACTVKTNPSVTDKLAALVVVDRTAESRARGPIAASTFCYVKKDSVIFGGDTHHRTIVSTRYEGRLSFSSPFHWIPTCH